MVLFGAVLNAPIVGVNCLCRWLSLLSLIVESSNKVYCLSTSLDNLFLYQCIIWVYVYLNNLISVYLLSLVVPLLSW